MHVFFAGKLWGLAGKVVYSPQIMFAEPIQGSEQTLCHLLPNHKQRSQKKTRHFFASWSQPRKEIRIRPMTLRGCQLVRRLSLSCSLVAMEKSLRLHTKSAFRIRISPAQLDDHCKVSRRRQFLRRSSACGAAMSLYCCTL